MLSIERLTPGDDPEALGKHDEFCTTSDDRHTAACEDCSLEHIVLGVGERGHSRWV
jgi:hypothetical protein